MKEILDVRWCESHAPLREGDCDRLINQYAYLSGSGEVGGEENKKWCEFFHRKERP